jgi:hypothetical protein
MATNVVATVLNESQAKILVHYLITSDGVDGEITNLIILDPQTGFAPPLNGDQLKYPFLQCTILQIWEQGSWFDMVLSFNAAAPLPVWVCNRDGSNYYDFRYFGGLKDRSQQDADGKVLLTTNGLDGTALSIGTLVIEFKKD